MLFNHSKLSFIIKTSSCLFILFSNCSDMGKKKKITQSIRLHSTFPVYSLRARFYALSLLYKSHVL